MKKILFLTSKINDKKKLFRDLVKGNLKNKDISIDICEMNDMFLSIDGSNINLRLSGKDIREYNLILFRGVKVADYLKASVIGLCAEKLNIKFVDKIYSVIGLIKSKLTSLVQLSTDGLKVPKTVYLRCQKTNNYKILEKELGVPFVAKELSLQKGKGVFLINNEKDYLALPKVNEADKSINDYLFQVFVEKDHEYRILVLGDEIGVWEEKIAKDKTEFRNNVSLGAEEIFFNKDNIPEALSKVSIKSAQIMDYQIAGVDVMTEKKTGEVYVLEVNRGPGLTYDEKVSPEFKEIAGYLEALI